MESLERICSEEQCTGCSACYNVCRHGAIIMQLDKEGFYRPNIDTNHCVRCGLCKRVCPVNSAVKTNNKPLSVYSGWSKNEEIRMTSASGGAFTELAKYFIEKLHGIVCGVAMNEHLEACHIFIDKESALSKLQGSKYIQSFINDSFRHAENYLKEGRNVLFSGTACQIAGLRNYLRKDYDNLYTVDLICHGVPSNRLFNDYIKFIEAKLRHKVYDVKFRNKRNSWIFYNMAFNSYKEKKTSKIKYEYEDTYFSSPFIRGFLRDFALRPSCYQCQYANTNRIADFTFADWWGYKAECKDDLGFDNKGVSLIFVNTLKAQKILPLLDLQLKERTLDAALLTNKTLKEPTMRPDSRNSFWSEYMERGFSDIVNRWLKPEKVTPVNYILNTYPNSIIRSLILKVCYYYEFVCKRCNIDIIRIKTK